MMIVDVQHHEPSVWLDWRAADVTTRNRLYKELEIASMNAVGISSVVLNPLEIEWALEAADEMPDTFAVYPTVNPRTTDFGSRGVVATIAGFARDPRIVGIRIVLAKASSRWIPRERADEAAAGDPPEAAATGTAGPVAHDLTEGIELFDAGGYDEILGACEREKVPVFVFAPTRVDKGAEIARRWPDLTVIIDHLGASQPPVADRDDPPFRVLPHLLELAGHPRVVLKLSSVPALSDTAFPYGDMWDSVMQLTAAFGADRLMWASDMSRFNGRLGLRVRNPLGEGDYPGKHNLSESLRFILDNPRLSETDKEWILGRSAQKWLGWPAAGPS